MRSFTKKSILQKIIISILAIILLTNFMFPNISKAVGDTVGGVLFEPIQALLTVLGDGIMLIINKCAGNNVTAWSEDPILVFWSGLSSIQIPIFQISPEKIFSNQVSLLDVNIMSPKEDSIAINLQSIVSGWYLAFRNLAIVGLLSVLAYMGIRIVVSSTAADKSKYKEMFFDWVIALCLLFFMHYIMSFSITIVEIVTRSISTNNQSIDASLTVDYLKNNYDVLYVDEQVLNQHADESGNIKFDLMEYVRYQLQPFNIDDTTKEIGYTIIYLTLVIYTVMFLFIYIKRLIYIIFLTVMAPLVALTYPIDKLRDGKAQGFNTWLKEYIFNLLIQPVHLLLYTVLLGTTIELASEYLIYPLVVLGCMLPAEKIIRKFFGFESSSTASSLMSGAIGGALVMQGINALGKGRKSGKSGKGGSDGKADGNNDNKIRMSNRVGPNKGERDDYAVNAIADDNSPRQTENTTTGQDTSTTQGNNTANQRTRLGNWVGNRVDEFKANAREQINNFKNTKPIRELAKTKESATNWAKNTKLGKGAATLGRKAGKGISRFRKGTGAVYRRYIKPNAKKAVKAIPKVYGAATLGAVGVAAGLASDDFSNVVKYGAGAGVVGSSLGGSVADKVGEIPKGIRELSDTFEKGYYTKDEYKQKANERADKQFMKNREVDAKLKEEFKDFKDANGNEVDMETLKNAALEYDRQGIDLDVAVKAMKAKSDFASADLADPKRIAAARYSMEASSKDDYKEVREGLKRRLGDAKYEQKKAVIEDQINMIRQINGNIL